MIVSEVCTDPAADRLLVQPRNVRDDRAAAGGEHEPVRGDLGDPPSFRSTVIAFGPVNRPMPESTVMLGHFGPSRYS